MEDVERITMKERILAEAIALMTRAGPDAVTFAAIGQRLGVSKQAVIYWFPTKLELFAAIALPCLREEAEVAADAARAASGRRAVGAAVVRALTDFHLGALQRFRLMYVAPQIGGQRDRFNRLAGQVHPVTGAMYSEIAAALGGGPLARQQAVALHMAALGHVLLVALTDAVADPLFHAPQALAETLAGIVSRGVADEG